MVIREHTLAIRLIGFVIALAAFQPKGFSQSVPDFLIQFQPGEVTIAPTNFATNPGLSSTQVKLRAFNLDGSPAGTSSGSIVLPGRGHSARFAREQIANLPNGFKGVVEIESSSPLAVLTIRSLVNARGDFLVTTFPVADLVAPTSSPVFFPQIADGGGYVTEFIFVGTGEPATLSLDFFTSDGRPLPVGK
jgi:hypothetical protein